MEHTGDLTALALIAAIAVVLGLVFTRLRQPPIVGYILAGVVLGPTGIGLVGHTGAITLLAELGVILLLFLIGMELSLRAFRLVLIPATLTVIAQIGSALIITLSFATLLGWPTEQAVLLAFIVAVSSTAVAMKMLEDIGELRSQTGRITVGVLIAQDIAVVPMIVLVGALSGDDGSGMWEISVKLLLTAIILGGVVYSMSRRGKVVLPFSDSIHGRVDLIALSSVAFCFAAAATTGLLGLSAAFGAFVAGLVVSNSTLRAEAIHVTEPIQSILMVVFFLSIGLLIDLDYIWANLGAVVAFVAGVLLIKTVVNVGILRLVGEPWERAFPAGLIMAQIGEFSFVLASVAITHGVIDQSGFRLAIAIIAVSLLVSPFWMVSVRRFHDIAQAGVTDFRSALADVYAGEIGEIERSAYWLKNSYRRSRLRLRAVRDAWRRRNAHGGRSGAMTFADPLAPGTADAYHLDDEQGVAADRNSRDAPPAELDEAADDDAEAKKKAGPEGPA